VLVDSSLHIRSARWSAQGGWEMEVEHPEELPRRTREEIGMEAAEMTTSDAMDRYGSQSKDSMFFWPPG